MPAKKAITKPKKKTVKEERKYCIVISNICDDGKNKDGIKNFLKVPVDNYYNRIDTDFFVFVCEHDKILEALDFLNQDDECVHDHAICIPVTIDEIEFYSKSSRYKKT